MPRLRMPVRYGSEIEDIKFTDFLELSDTVKPVISLPVGIKVPVRDRGIASGKLLRCDNNGILLRDKIKCCRNYELVSIEFTYAEPIFAIEFSQRVCYCTIFAYEAADVTGFYWTNPTGTLNFQDFGYQEVAFVNFAGRIMYIKATFTNSGEIKVYAHGFY